MKNYYHKKAPLQLIDKEHKRRQRKPKSFSTAFTHLLTYLSQYPPILYPLKTPQNLWFSGVLSFKGI